MDKENYQKLREAHRIVRDELLAIEDLSGAQRQAIETLNGVFYMVESLVE